MHHFWERYQVSKHETFEFWFWKAEAYASGCSKQNFIIKWSTANGLVCVTLNTKTCLGPECLSCSPLLQRHVPWNLLRFLIPDRITKVPGEYKNLNPYNKHKENKHLKQGWRDGSTAKSTDCSGRGSRLHPQHPHRATHNHLSLTPRASDTSSLHRHLYSRVHFHRETQHRHTNRHAELKINL